MSKPSSLYGFGGSSNRKCLQDLDSLTRFSSKHIQALFTLQQMCHVSAVPFIVLCLDDILDCAVGDLCHLIIDRKETSISSTSDEIAPMFYALQQAYKEPEGEDNSFNQAMTNCIIISNIYNLLLLLEQEWVVHTAVVSPSVDAEVMASIQAILFSKDGKSLDGLSYLKSQLGSHPFAETASRRLIYPIFSKIAQVLVNNTELCRKLTGFVDNFVFTLFEHTSELNTSSEYSVLIQSLSHALSFLLTVTCCWSAFVDGGECMRVWFVVWNDV